MRKGIFSTSDIRQEKVVRYGRLKFNPVFRVVKAPRALFSVVLGGPDFKDVLPFKFFKVVALRRLKGCMVSRLDCRPTASPRFNAQACVSVMELIGKLANCRIQGERTCLCHKQSC